MPRTVHLATNEKDPNVKVVGKGFVRTECFMCFALFLHWTRVHLEPRIERELSTWK